MDKELIQDLLKSVKRLNEECSERVEFENKLMEAIEVKDERIKKLQIYCDAYCNERDRLQEELDMTKQEAYRFKEQVAEMFLKDGEQFVWNDEKLEVYKDS